MDSRSRIWTPLDPAKRQIRLFILAPNKNEAALPEGRLITVSLNQPLHYDAVSHAWGTPSQPEVVYIDGVEWLITNSLYEALRRLRDHKNSRSLWIDALCINQFDNRERSSQVQLMQFIFNQAITVQIWLGCHEPTIINFVKTMKDGSLSKMMFDRRKSDRELDADRAGLAALASLQYFKRLWVIQEAALAREIRFLYDNESFTIDKLQRMFLQFQNSRIKDLSAVHFHYITDRLALIMDAPSLLPMATPGSVEAKASRLIGIMQKARFLQCSDPRDRIYGLLGIITAMFGPGFLVPDYDLSIPDVYTEFAGRLISTTGSLALLNQAEFACNSTVGLPTWVPDWSSNFDHRDAARRQDFEEQFRPCGNFAHPEIQAASEYLFGRILKVTSYKIDVVGKVGLYARSNIAVEPRVRGNLNTLQEWRRLFLGSSDTFVRTITLDLIHPPPSLEECYDAVDPESSESTKRLTLVYNTLMIAIGSRRFFITQSGSAGLGPVDVKEGDRLAILGGGNVVYVLRPGSSPESFYLVGESYVHGVMRGQLSKSPLFAEREIILE